MDNGIESLCVISSLLSKPLRDMWLIEILQYEGGALRRNRLERLEYVDESNLSNQLDTALLS